MNKDIVVSINRLNARGRGLGSCPAFTLPVEVISGLPGDELIIELSGKKRGKRLARIKEVSQASPLRAAPRCQHVPLCGGCSWQQMKYTEQLSQKEKIIASHFSALNLKIEIRPILSAKDPWRYRNKMEFSFSQNLAGEQFLGLIIAGSRGHVLNLQECHLASLWFVDVLKNVRQWWKESGLSAYKMNDTGALRNLTLREGLRTGDKMVMLTVSGNPAYPIKQTQLDAFIKSVQASSPDGVRLSIFLRIHQIKKGVPTQFYEMHLFGPDHILEKLTINGRELTFKISPTSFFQPNSAQAEVLYSEALKMVSIPKKHVMDLYAGTATLGMAIALSAERVTAIELNPHAIFDAESNRALNQITNLRLICGDVGKKLYELKKEEGFISPDLVIIDPPRSGLDATALSQLKELLPEEILYVSCNVETQVANIQELRSMGYEPVIIQPVDQFPHTVHIENIVLLKRGYEEATI